MQNPFLVSLPLNPEIWNKIKITANDQRIEGSGIELGPLIDNVVHSHRLVLEHDVIPGQKNQIDVAKPFLGKPCENVDFFRTMRSCPVMTARSRSLSGRPRPDASDPKR